MTREEVKAARKEIDLEARKHKAAGRMIAAKYRALEDMCDHPKAKTWQDYGGGTNWSCPDCGADR